MIFRRRFFYFVTTLLILLGCETKEKDVLKPTVVVSFSILEDLVKQIGEDHVHVISIVPRLADPHVYQLKPSDMVTLKSAHLILAHGLGFEGWLKGALSSSEHKEKYVEVAAHLNARTLPDGTKDPHTWHDVNLTLKTIPEIVKVLGRILPSKQDIFQKNGQKYAAKLLALDTEVKKAFEKIPLEKRIVVTTHDAFWYFGKAYGVKFLSPLGISTEQEPSATTIADLIQLVRQKNIKAIFIENLSNGRVVEQIARETGSKPDGILYADSVSEEIGPAEDYVKMILYNMEKIISAF